jgi:NADPH-dependent 2,4-dienoyl-CoA reductase/sulfur reductase-like enzyme/rhodanese-related sulfurtransferase
MSKHVIIVGAVALGPKVGCRLRRLDPDVKITIVERDSLISYGGCGIPYYVGGDISDIEGLCSTSSHVVRDTEFFRTSKGVTILSQTEAVAIDRKLKTLTVRDLQSGDKSVLTYDKLVIATGATPFRPPIPGADLPCVYTVSNLHNAKEIKDKISREPITRAVVIGAGAIGIEMAEALSDLWGVRTTIIEMADQVLPQALGPDMAGIVEAHLKENNIKVMLSQRVEQIHGDTITGVTSVETQETTIECHMVVMSAGVRPNTAFAAAAGLAVEDSGALLVDRCLRTSDPHIYAGGDCVSLRNLVSGANITMPLGSLANRQGRIIANNIHGRATQFPGTVGTFCIKVFEMGVATAGLTVKQARDAGFEPVHAIAVQSDRAHFYPEAQLMFIQLIADKKTRKILGIEAAGSQGDAIKARVDSVAPLLSAGIDVDDICMIETGYAPPYASAMDIINNAGNVLDNIFEKRNHAMDALDFFEAFDNDEFQVIDVREVKEAEPFVEKFKARWMNIPQSEIRSRIDDIPKDRPVCLICGTGARSYECQVILAQAGLTNTRNVQGGFAMLRALKFDFL